MLENSMIFWNIFFSKKLKSNTQVTISFIIVSNTEVDPTFFFHNKPVQCYDIISLLRYQVGTDNVIYVKEMFPSIFKDSKAKTDIAFCTWWNEAAVSITYCYN